KELEAQVAVLKSERNAQDLTRKDMESNVLKLKTTLALARKENESIREEMESFISVLGESAPPPCQTSSDCSRESCSQYQLCARRIFMIGGITKMKAYYKDIVEKAGGEFDYHDGYIKGAGMDIEARVKRSDLVLCPVNCNSHNACIRVKKLCNQHNTPLKILASSSLSAVGQAVFSQENTTTLN
ncbi:MAG: DUF2325 domain-containing protein, partial [Desulfobacterales bacterium]|nr:DUF2325 domain-containing protein [Desulfobacterales bacterium]